MTARFILVAFSILVLVAAGAGCGGDDSSGLSSESEAAIAQIETICNDAAAEISSKRGDFPVADFDPTNPDPADLPAVGNYFAIGHVVSDAALVKARAVDVPAEIQGKVDTLLNAVESDLANAKAQAKAARESDVAAFTATLDDADRLSADVKDASDALGVDCNY